MTRIGGPKTLASVSAFDFTANVAVGAMVGSVILRTEVGLAAGAVAVAAIFALQFVIGQLRARPRLQALFDNTPTLVMRDGRVLHHKLAATRLVEADLQAAMRAANVHRYADVDAIVLEKTGSLSVVHH